MRVRCLPHQGSLQLKVKIIWTAKNPSRPSSNIVCSIPEQRFDLGYQNNFWRVWYGLSQAGPESDISPTREPQLPNSGEFFNVGNHEANCSEYIKSNSRPIIWVSYYTDRTSVADQKSAVEEVDVAWTKLTITFLSLHPCLLYNWSVGLVVNRMFCSGKDPSSRCPIARPDSKVGAISSCDIEWE